MRSPNGSRGTIWSDMVLPFEVATPPSELYSGLLALSKAPAARGIYGQHDLRRLVVSFFWRQRLHCLAEAVAAALGAGGEIRVLRNATLGITRCVIPPGRSVTIVPIGGPYRISHLANTHTALFVICNGAGLIVRKGVRFRALRLNWRPLGGGHAYFYMYLPGPWHRSGRAMIRDVVHFEGYAEISHRAENLSEMRMFPPPPSIELRPWGYITHGPA